MFQLKSKKQLAAGIALGVSLAVSGSVMAAAHGGGKPVVTNPSGMGVVTGYGECWGAVGGQTGVGNCGGMPAPKPAPKPAAPKDSDGDGVVDSRDECPGTPRGVPVTAFGCPKDTDGDGIADYQDKCPNSRPGARVNAGGCEIIPNVSINLVEDEFDVDSAHLKPGMMAALDDIAAKLQATPGNEYLNIVGHTDSTGAEAYNQDLSVRRAKAVAAYLESKGIPAGTMHTSGRGESQPVADNGTRAGRAKNRRVDIATN